MLSLIDVMEDLGNPFEEENIDLLVLKLQTVSLWKLLKMHKEFPFRLLLMHASNVWSLILTHICIRGHSLQAAFYKRSTYSNRTDKCLMQLLIVLLEYINLFLWFIKRILAWHKYPSHYASIILNTLRHLLCSKLHWHNQRVPRIGKENNQWQYMS